jgi:hypothetical protein
MPASLGSSSTVDSENRPRDDIGEPFSVTAGNLGVQLTDRMKLARDTITKQMFDVIAADYR